MLHAPLLYSLVAINSSLSGAGTLSFYPLWTAPDALRTITFTAFWNFSGTATLAATFALWATNDPQARPVSSAQSSASWIDITSSVTGASNLDATSGNGSGDLTVDNLAYECLKVVVTYSSGSGPYKLIIGGR